MHKVARILGTVKSKEESWEQLFARANKEGGVDVKTIIAILVVILEELDNARKERNAKLPRESREVPRGTREAKTEISDRISD